MGRSRTRQAILHTVSSCRAGMVSPRDDCQISPFLRSAKTSRKVLLAIATATTFPRQCPSSRMTHSKPASVFLALRNLAIAPSTSSLRKEGLPILDIRPRRPLPPLEWGLGVKPCQSAKWRADLKPLMSGTSALADAAGMAPTPGMVVNRCACRIIPQFVLSF